MKVVAKVLNGEIVNPKAMMQSFLIRNEGKDIIAEYKEKRNQRSKEQNSYYWAVVVPMLAEELGYTMDEMHDSLKFQFLREGDLDAKLPKVRSTTDLDTVEFNHYITQIQILASELGINIPDPHF